MPDPPAIIPFESEDGVDEAGALREACRSLEKLEWMEDNLAFFFNRVETRMGVAGVKKNFTKFQVLSEILPKQVQDQVMNLLTLNEADFPNKDAYKQLKTEVFRIFGPRPEQAVERALGRVLAGKPSALARSLVNDLCKEKLNCRCCPAIVSTLWKRQLGSSVRAGIAHMELSKDNFNAMTQLADDIHESSNPRAAPVAAVVQASLDETQPAIPYAQQEVAAIRGGNRGGRGGRGNRGGRGGGQRGGRGGAQNNGQASGASGGGGRDRGPRHPDGPPDKACRLHWKFGKSANFCVDPAVCPWKNIFAPRSQSNQ